MTNNQAIDDDDDNSVSVDTAEGKISNQETVLGPDQARQGKTRQERSQYLAGKPTFISTQIKTFLLHSLSCI